jgi:hypothetical protein
MAQVTRVNGDFKPVLNVDAREYTNTGVNAVVSAATVQAQGPKLDFFTVTADGALTGANVKTIIDTIQQLAVVYIYEYTDAADDTLAVAVYPTGAYTAATLEAAVVAAGFATATAAATATFTN